MVRMTNAELTWANESTRSGGLAQHRIISTLYCILVLLIGGLWRGALHIITQGQGRWLLVFLVVIYTKFSEAMSRAGTFYNDYATSSSLSLTSSEAIKYIC